VPVTVCDTPLSCCVHTTVVPLDIVTVAGTKAKFVISTDTCCAVSVCVGEPVTICVGEAVTVSVGIINVSVGVINVSVGVGCVIVGCTVGAGVVVVVGAAHPLSNTARTKNPKINFFFITFLPYLSY
jgi:hypothetical protein